MTIQILAILAVIILLGLAVFQISLILGYPLGKFAWGGANKILPTKLRVASAFSIILYILFGLIILDRSGLISILGEGMIRSQGIQVLTAYFALGIFVNAISRSKSERNVMTPVAIALFILCLIISLNS